MKYHAKYDRIHIMFAEASRLLIFACGRFIQNSMSAIEEDEWKAWQYPSCCVNIKLSSVVGKDPPSAQAEIS